MEINLTKATPHPRRCPYFEIVVGLAWPNGPESYAGVSVAIGRASYARQAKDDDPDKKEYPDFSGWGLGVGLTLHPIEHTLVEKLLKLKNRLMSTKDCNARSRRRRRRRRRRPYIFLRA